VLAGVAGLWALAADGVERAVAARHDDALRRVVAGLEREFGAVVAREDSRPFLEWRYLYVPLDNANPAVVRSSLAQGPTDPAVRGYFSLEPDGTFLSPERPRGNELELVQQNLWSPPPQDGRDLEALVRTLPLGLGAAARAGSSSCGRRSSSGPGSYNVDTFASAKNAFDPGDGAEREVTVEVRPFRGLRRGDDLVLVRDVVAAGAVYRQGLVLDVRRLTDAAAAEVLVEEGLTGAVALDWSGGVAPGAHTLSHTFAAPLQEVAVSVGVGELPELVGRARLGVVTLGGAVVLLVLGRGVARGAHGARGARVRPAPDGLRVRRHPRAQDAAHRHPDVRRDAARRHGPRGAARGVPRHVDLRVRPPVAARRQRVDARPAREGHRRAHAGRRRRRRRGRRGARGSCAPTRPPPGSGWRWWPTRGCRPFGSIATASCRCWSTSSTTP
jgi:hypothetical protein